MTHDPKVLQQEACFGLDITGKTENNKEKTLTLVVTVKVAKELLVALYKASRINNIRDYMRKEKVFPDQYQVLRFMVCSFSSSCVLNTSHYCEYLS